MRFLLLAVVLLSAVTASHLPVQAQPSPQLDPSFQPTALYRPAPAETALQLRSGARVLAGYFSRAEGQPTGATGAGLVRYLPTGTPDLVFNAAVAADNFTVSTMAEAANGKLLLGLFDGATIGGQRVPALVQLEADGTRDPGFANPAPGLGGYVSSMLVQADGKIVVAGYLSFLGQSPVPGLARLLVNGTPDASFQPQLTSGLLNGARSIVQQPDGKLLLMAYVVPAAGQPGQWRVLRLHANGTQDTSFQPALNPSAALGAVAVQPDGKVLVTSINGQPVLVGGVSPLARLSATGQPDASFTQNYQLQLQGSGAVLVQPDGRILVGNLNAQAAGQAPVARLLASGAFDPTWNVPNVPGDLFPRPNSLQLLPSGQVLVAGMLLRLGAVAGRERGAALLEANGQVNPTFDPLLQNSGVVRDITQQPDGKLVAVGDFTEVNGTEVRNMVRFQTDGTVDTAFSRHISLTGGLPARVLAQPDGKLLVGGSFLTVNGAAHVGVVRLLPGGPVDATFAPLFLGLSATNGGSSSISELARQPDGRLLVAGTLRRTGQANASFLRLETSGAVDATFQPGVVVPQVLLVQPDGGIVVGRSQAAALVVRLLPGGAIDPSFTAPAVSSPTAVRVTALARYPDGRLLLVGGFTQVGSVATTNVARLLANGMADASFATQAFTTSSLTGVAIQPNERVLLTGPAQLPQTPASPSLHRLLPDGSLDTSFDSWQGPAIGATRVLVQPDGAIVTAGSFSSVSGLPVLGVARLLDAQVLAGRVASVAGSVQIWPVPAHEVLHFVLPATARRVRLLNTLGQVVRSQPASTGDMTINTADLAPGLYLLEVAYADAVRVVQRVVLE